MKILLVTHDFVYPPRGGASVRNFNLIKRISERCQIYLISFADFATCRGDIEYMHQYCKEVIAIPISNTQSIVKYLNSLTLKKPYKVLQSYSSKMKRKISDILTKERFDLVHFDHIYLAQYIPQEFNIPLIITAHNVEFLLINRYIGTSDFVRTIYGITQWPILKKYELEMYSRANRVIVVSKKDKETLLKLNNKLKLSVVENGVDCSYFKPSLSKKKNSLVFTGSMFSYPNIDGILYFCKEILPLIKEEVSDVTLYIVGRNPHRKIRKIADVEGVVATGTVDDIRPYIANCDVYIVPLRIGGGTRLKILEALASGKPVVSTSIGCEGLEVEDGVNILVADTPYNFANAVIQLLGSPSLSEKLIIEGRKLIENKYNWQKLAESLFKTYKETLDSWRGR